jgi:hypothetical protein
VAYEIKEIWVECRIQQKKETSVQIRIREWWK